MLVAFFQGQIVFLDKLLYISKNLFKTKKNSYDADGKAIPKKSYAIAFHYANDEVSRVLFSTEEERDKAWNEFLNGSYTIDLLDLKATKEIKHEI